MNQKHNKLRALSLLITVLIEKNIYPNLQEHLVSHGRGYSFEMLGPLKIDDGEHAVNGMLMHYRVYLFNQLRHILKKIEQQEDQYRRCCLNHPIFLIKEIKSNHVISIEEKKSLTNTRDTVLNVLKTHVTKSKWEDIGSIRSLDKWLNFFEISRAEITTPQTLPQIINAWHMYEQGVFLNNEYYHEQMQSKYRILADIPEANTAA